jgi:hypothetical protein
MKKNKQSTFVTYRKFNSLMDAVPLMTLLKQNDIEYVIENASPSLDITFSANTMLDEYRIQISQSDFEKVDALLENISDVTVDEIDADHYLFEFTDEELKSILETPDEWSITDFVFARTILSKRGIEFTDEQLEDMRNARIRLLKTTRKTPRNFIFAGYVFALLGGVGGIAIGWYLKNFRKTIFTGEQVWEYDEKTRKIGAQIFTFGLVVNLLCVILFLWYWFAKLTA